MSILVVNAGSTSLKFGLFDHEAREALISGNIEWPDGNRDRAAFSVSENGREPVRTTVSVPADRVAAACAIDWVKRRHAIGLVGHRVVHGGAVFTGHRLVNEEVKAVIARLKDLAPLHNPPALEAILAAEAALPGVPQAAVFDTAFFAPLPPRAYLYPLPFDWQVKWGVRKFGFHGISNSFCALRAREMLAPRHVPGDSPANHTSSSSSAGERAPSDHGTQTDPADFRLITCHLGGGCSATAVRQGQPVATTMGFSPLEGLMMGSRCGSIDPGLLIYLQRHCGLSLDRIDLALNYESGLAGISGLCADLAKIETAMAEGNERAKLAFDLFTDRVRSAIGALAVTMGGLDVLVFTDRIGENSSACRAAVCQGLECLGVQLDPGRNQTCRPDVDIAVPGSRVRVLVLRTREELMIAREAKALTAPTG